MVSRARSRESSRNNVVASEGQFRVLLERVLRKSGYLFAKQEKTTQAGPEQAALLSTERVA